MTVRVRVRLTFPEALVTEPVLSRLLRAHPVEVNIRRADVAEHEGWMLLEVDGQPAEVEAALGWLRGTGVRVDLLGDVLEG